MDIFLVAILVPIILAWGPFETNVGCKIGIIRINELIETLLGDLSTTMTYGIAEGVFHAGVEHQAVGDFEAMLQFNFVALVVFDAERIEVDIFGFVCLERIVDSADELVGEGGVVSINLEGPASASLGQVGPFGKKAVT